MSRIPAQLDVGLMREPRVIQGVPRMDMPGKRVGRKAVPSLLGGNAASRDILKGK